MQILNCVPTKANLVVIQAMLLHVVCTYTILLSHETHCVCPSLGVLQEATVRAMANFFNPIVGETPEVTEAWDSEPNPGLADRTVSIYTGTTLGGSSAVNGAQFSTPTNEVQWRQQLCFILTGNCTCGKLSC